jgi:hypothetical protein
MRLVRSSVAGAVERDAALRLLSERAVLTRMLCRELLEAEEALPDRRVDTAFSILLSWIAQNFPESTRTEPHPSDGLDRMTVPEEGCHLLAEIADGAQVGEALFMWLTAETRMDADHDKAILRERLENYWAKHRLAVRPPWSVDDKWLSSEDD